MIVRIMRYLPNGLFVSFPKELLGKKGVVQ